MVQYLQYTRCFNLINKNRKYKELLTIMSFCRAFQRNYLTRHAKKQKKKKLESNHQVKSAFFLN